MAGLVARYDDFRSRFPLHHAGAFPFIERAGSGPTLVLLHGSLGNEYAFFPLFEHLPATIRLVSLRLPDALDTADLAPRFETFCREQGLDQIVLIGTSIGGYIAQFLASSAHVRAVIMSSAMVSLTHMPTFPDEKIEDIAAMTPAGMLSGLLEPMMARWPGGHSGLDAAHTLIRQRIVPDNPPARYMGRARFVSAYRDAPGMTLAPGNMLIIDSMDDPIIPSLARNEVRLRYPDARAHRFEWGGHFPYLAREKDYAGVIEGFLNEVAP